MSDCLTLVFARSPEEERRVKPLGERDEAARNLHRVVLERALRVAASSDSDVRWVATGDLEQARLLGERLVDASRFGVAAQVGNGLGEKLTHAFEQAFSDGYRRVVVLGGDTPGLTTFELTEAFAALAGPAPRAVLGPAPDGGFYLLGVSAPIGGLFDGVALCTSHAGTDTLAALEANGFLLTQLRPLADLDDRDDLVLLRRRLNATTPADLRLLAAIDAVLSAAPLGEASASRIRPAPVRRNHAARAPPLAR